MFHIFIAHLVELNYVLFSVTHDGITLRNPTENSELCRNSCQTSTTQTTTTTTADIEKRGTSIGSLGRVRIKLYSQWNSLPWDRLKTVKWKNDRATEPGAAYMPTEVRFHEFYDSSRKKRRTTLNELDIF